MRTLLLLSAMVALSACSPTVYEISYNGKYMEMVCDTYVWQPNHQVCHVDKNPSTWKDRPANLTFY